MTCSSPGQVDLPGIHAPSQRSDFSVNRMLPSRFHMTHYVHLIPVCLSYPIHASRDWIPSKRPHIRVPQLGTGRASSSTRRRFLLLTFHLRVQRPSHTGHTISTPAPRVVQSHTHRVLLEVFREPDHPGPSAGKQIPTLEGHLYAADSGFRTLQDIGGSREV